jgi:hypothetical protein
MHSQADDDDLDDLSFGGPATANQPLNPSSSSSSNQAGGSGSQSQSANALGGRIGSTPSGGRREDWGGVRTETRFTGESTLDEPVSVTIVSSLFLRIIQKLRIAVEMRGKQGSDATFDLLDDYV